MGGTLWPGFKPRFPRLSDHRSTTELFRYIYSSIQRYVWERYPISELWNRYKKVVMRVERNSADSLTARGVSLWAQVLSRLHMSKKYLHHGEQQKTPKKTWNSGLNQWITSQPLSYSWVDANTFQHWSLIKSVGRRGYQEKNQDRSNKRKHCAFWIK